MIHYVAGDIFTSSAEALVNPVNTTGVMGAGLAREFRRRFPDAYIAYAEACRRGKVQIGRVFVYDRGRAFPRYILHFPTKRHWRNPSRMEYIEKGLDDLVRVVHLLGVRHVAVPALGAGLGGLRWDDVRALMERKLSTENNVQWDIFEPR